MTCEKVKELSNNDLGSSHSASQIPKPSWHYTLSFLDSILVPPYFIPVEELLTWTSSFHHEAAHHHALPLSTWNSQRRLKSTTCIILDYWAIPASLTLSNVRNCPVFSSGSLSQVPLSLLFSQDLIRHSLISCLLNNWSCSSLVLYFLLL